MLDFRFPLWKIIDMSTILKTWRVGAQKSAEDVAKEIGVTLPMWSRWENGRRRIPAERVPEIERVTGIPREQLRPDVFRRSGVAA